jgi:hypothetical protein
MKNELETPLTDSLAGTRDQRMSVTGGIVWAGAFTKITQTLIRPGSRLAKPRREHAWPASNWATATTHSSAEKIELWVTFDNEMAAIDRTMSTKRSSHQLRLSPKSRPSA